MANQIRSKALINRAYVNGVETFNIVARAENVDAQIWLDVSSFLPARLKLNYKKEPGNPQFWANFTNWQLGTPIDDGKFVMNYEGFEKIQFSPIN